MREALFRLAPAMRYDFHNEYKYLLDQYEWVSKAHTKNSEENSNTQ